jgi:hypothetical protein
LQKPTKDPKFPALMWHPETGEASVFNSAEEIPEGYLDKHPKHAGDVKPIVKTELSRSEIIAALRERGIEFAPATGTPKLYDLLVNAIEAKEA